MVGGAVEKGEAAREVIDVKPNRLLTPPAIYTDTTLTSGPPLPPAKTYSLHLIFIIQIRRAHDPGAELRAGVGWLLMKDNLEDDINKEYTKRNK